MKIIQNKRKSEFRNEIPALLTDNMDISAEAKILWIKLYNSNRGKGNYIKWKPSTQSLATMFKVDKRTIKRWIKELKDTGWINILGDRNDTTVFVNYTPVIGDKNDTKTGDKNVPQYYKDALRSEASESASTINTNNHSDSEDLDRFFEND